MRLKTEEFVPYAPDEVGPRERRNHASGDCSGDSLSLSIWRNEDGTVGAKCFRCGATGRAGTKPSMYKKPSETKALQEVPKDVSSCYEDMPPEAATYLASKGITEAIAFHYGIGWSSEADGLILPVINQYEYDQAQVKYFGKKNRYTTIHRGHRETLFTHIKDYDPLPCVVVVEDLISAIRVKNALPECDAFALLGSELNDQGLATLVRNHDQFVIWLDNDNRQIMDKAGKLFNQLGLFGVSRLIREQVEPKDITDQEVINVFYGTHK